MRAPLIRPCYASLAFLGVGLIAICSITQTAQAGWLAELLRAEHEGAAAERGLGNVERGAVDAKHGAGRIEQEDTAAAMAASHNSALNNHLHAAYRPAALDEISDAAARGRIGAVIHTHSYIQIAALVGREKQFESVAQSGQYMMHFAKGFSVSGPTEHTAMQRAHAATAADLRIILSFCSDNLAVSEFRSHERYLNALRDKLKQAGSGLGEKEDRKFKFNVSSGELEIPLKVNVGPIEISAGSVNLYEAAEKAADKIFNGSSIVAALGSPDNSDQSNKPSARLVTDEEMKRRQIKDDLSDDDAHELERIAPDLFA